MDCPNSSDSDAFYVQWSSGEQNPPRKNTPDILNSRELSGARAKVVITISSVASPASYIVTIETNSKTPTMPYSYGRRQPNIPSSLKDLNLPKNPFNVMTLFSPAPRTEAHLYPTQVDDSPIQPEITDILDIATPLKGQYGGWLANIFRRRGVWIRRATKFISRLKPFLNVTATMSTKEWAWECLFQKRGVSQHTCKACGQPLLSKKTTLDSEWNLYLHVELINFHLYLQLLYMWSGPNCIQITH